MVKLEGLILVVVGTHNFDRRLLKDSTTRRPTPVARARTKLAGLTYAGVFSGQYIFHEVHR